MHTHAKVHAVYSNIDPCPYIAYAVDSCTIMTGHYKADSHPNIQMPMH